jgi:hypothetical protein
LYNLHAPVRQSGNLSGFLLTRTGAISEFTVLSLLRKPTVREYLIVPRLVGTSLLALRIGKFGRQCQSALRAWSNWITAHCGTDLKNKPFARWQAVAVSVAGDFYVRDR